MTAETLQHTFPHLVEEAEILANLNKEELGNQEGRANQQPLTHWETKKNHTLSL